MILVLLSLDPSTDAYRECRATKPSSSADEWLGIGSGKYGRLGKLSNLSIHQQFVMKSACPECAKV